MQFTITIPLGTKAEPVHKLLGWLDDGGYESGVISANEEHNVLIVMYEAPE